MFLYKGFNPDDSSKEQKEFEDEYEAIEYARENCVDFRKYEVINMEDNTIVDSDKIAQDEEDATMDMMFPEGEDE